MSKYEYKVVPAPAKGLKAKGIKTSQDRFANALETTMNELGAEGWEYQRTDTLPCEERSGLTGKVTTFQHMLVFRRAITEEVEAAPITAPIVAPVVTPEPEVQPVAERTQETLAATADDAFDDDEPEISLFDEDGGRKEPQVAAE